MKKYLAVLLFFVVLSCSKQHDFESSNWGDKIEEVAKVSSNNFDIELSTDMLSYKQQILGKEATVIFLFQDNRLISGFIKFEKLSGPQTKIVYDSLVEQFSTNFGTEIFDGNQKEMEGIVFNQKIWDDNRTVVSIRLDSNQIFIKYYDKHKMPVN